MITFRHFLYQRFYCINKARQTGGGTLTDMRGKRDRCWEGRGIDIENDYVTFSPEIIYY